MDCHHSYRPGLQWRLSPSVFAQEQTTEWHDFVQKPCPLIAMSVPEEVIAAFQQQVINPFLDWYRGQHQSGFKDAFIRLGEFMSEALEIFENKEQLSNVEKLASAMKITVEVHILLQGRKSVSYTHLTLPTKRIV